MVVNYWRAVGSVVIVASILVGCTARPPQRTVLLALAGTGPGASAGTVGSTGSAGAVTATSTAAPTTGPILSRVWVAPSLSRVGLADPVGPTASAAIFGARGESQSFQVIVQAPPGGLTGVGLAVAALRDAHGVAIPTSAFTLYREHYVHVPGPSPNGGGNPSLGPGWYADALIPFVDPDTGLRPSGAFMDLVAVPFAAAAGRNIAFWVDVNVPRGAAPGVYRGDFRLTSDQGSAPVPVSLTVWNFALPVVPTLRSSFLVSGTPDLGTFRELLRNRVMPSSVAPRDQRALIDQGGLSSVNVGFWSGADAGTCAMPAAPAPHVVHAAAVAHDPALYRYAYTADEIDGCANAALMHDTIKAWSRSLHAAGVKNLITMAPTRALFDNGAGRSAVDVWVVLPKTYDAAGALIGEALALGSEVWSYNACVQDDYSPKWQIDFAPVNFRIQPGFIGQSLSITGLLYWRVDYWTAAPWTDVTTMRVQGTGFAGEGMLVYPGRNVGTRAPAPSMRLKWLRDGVNDYEYVEILKANGRGSWALDRARSVGRDWRTWTRDPAALEAVRRALGEAIHAIGPP